MEREWKTCDTLQGFYEVSNDGFIRRIKDIKYRPVTGKFLVPQVFRCGHLNVKITIGGICVRHYVHAIVAEAFIGPRPAKLVINHKDGNPANNKVDNLEYVTQKENVHHARKMGRCNQNFVLTEDQARHIKQLMANGMREIEVVRLLGIKRHFVNTIRMGKSWAHVKI